MSFSSGRIMAMVSGGALSLLAGCAQQGPPSAPEVAFNPPGTALAALPGGSVVWHHVAFATNSARIDADGRRAIGDAADSMRANPALTATVIGKADSVGGDAANMRLARQRAVSVRDALIQAGTLPAARVETRWTGERMVGAVSPGNATEPNSRVVDIGLH